MLSSKLRKFGDLDAIIYDFAEGDGLPMHEHIPETEHITIVVRGKIIAKSIEWTEIYEAGAIVDFHSGEPHEITALVNDTRIVNIMKHRP